MTKPNELPETLRAYAAHGLDIKAPSPGQTDVMCDCPFCGREGKFGIGVANGVWRCLVCATGSEKGGGNVFTFLRALWDASDQATTDYETLAAHRKLIDFATVMTWGVARSTIDGTWMVPGYRADKKLMQLYRYVNLGDRNVLLATASIPHALHGVNLYDARKDYVYLFEGPWDAMAFWEALRCTRRDESGNLVPTANPDASLAKDANVLAAPGCAVWREEWAELFADKRVVIMYDSDHPRENPKTGATIAPAGWNGAERVARALAKAARPPHQISVLRWGPGGFDPTLPSGHDVRDALAAEGDTGIDRSRALADLLDRVEATPEAWGAAAKAAPGTRGSVQRLELKKCDRWDDLILAFRKALRWTDGLERGLASMLASVASVRLPGDQLWMKIISPPSGGKSTLCEAVSAAHKYVVAKSTIRGFHSGMRDADDKTKDNSLIALLKDKTLITKDGDTILQQPNLTQILAEARDIYDRVSRTHYRNGLAHEYDGVNMTWLLCGTESLRALDTSELGERFLDCIMMKDIDEELEDDIGYAAIGRMIANRGVEANGRPESQQTPEMTEAMRMCGGYVEYLRENVTRLLDALDEPTEEVKRQLLDLGRFVAIFRARPSKSQTETVTREVSTRLRIQLTRYAMCVAVVLGRTSLDDVVMRRTTEVALDTARGKTFEAARVLHQYGDDGLEAKALAIVLARDDDETSDLVKFLAGVRAVEVFQRAISAHMKGKPRWRLTQSTRALYDRVMSYSHAKETTWATST